MNWGRGVGIGERGTNGYLWHTSIYCRLLEFTRYWGPAMASTYSPRLGPAVHAALTSPQRTPLTEKKQQQVQKDYAHIRRCGRRLIYCSAVFFVLTMYAIVGAKFFPYMGNPFLDFLKDDTYYSLLIPLLIPTIILGIYLNWLSMKFYRHN